VPTNGNVCVHFSIIDRMKRGGSASRNIVAPITMPSSGTWPLWLLINKTRPRGTFSMPWTCVRK
jgi:hypothetical protein